MDKTLITNRWSTLREYTDARIAIGRAGTSQPTKAHLQFQWDHARARDAVTQQVDFADICQQLESEGYPCLELSSATQNRQQYLQRPDLGRQLSEQSKTTLCAHRRPEGYDIAIAIGDGLSSSAINRHALPFLQELLQPLNTRHFSLAPICLVNQARVAISDDIGTALNARLVVQLIGERPGLSAPDSLGLYLTYAPKPGRTDAERNCISNIRQGGLSYQQASRTCMYLIDGAFRQQQTGVHLKDQSHTLEQTQSDQMIPFFVP